MKKIIGNRSSRLQLLRNIIIIALLGLCVGKAVLNMMKIGDFYLLIVIAFLTVLIIFPITVFYYNCYWYIEDDKVKYLHLNDYFEKWIYAILILFFGENNKFERQIAIKDIEKAELCVEKQYVSYGFECYHIQIKITDNKGKIVIIDTNVNQKQKRILYNNLLLISNINNKIIVEDKLGIMEHLMDDREKLYNYIKERLNNYENNK
ncbi:hypothetical protein [Eggerthia catenaformis]|uniref:hypothetical protein n=1 Tax=Eggerthia catenaformis TaxID=31973 RepID=UPI00248F379F|nr:hypothetical protein [Eggerthia catenaformis]